MHGRSMRLPTLGARIAARSYSRSTPALATKFVPEWRRPSEDVIKADTSELPTLDGLEYKWDSLPAVQKHRLCDVIRANDKKDWRDLNIDDKRAAYFVSFGPHGPRAKIFTWPYFWKVMGGIGVGLVVSWTVFSSAKAAIYKGHPKSFDKAHQESLNERAIREAMDPVTGVSSAGYKGSGYVTTK